MKSQTKTWVTYGLAALILIGMFIFAFERFDREDEGNTHELQGILSNVEYHGSYDGSCVSFEINDVYCFCRIRISSASLREIYETLQDLSGSSVTVMCSEDRYIRVEPEWWGCEEVVAVTAGDDEVVSLDAHNHHEKVCLILSLIGTGLLTVVVVGYIFVMEVILTDHTHKKRKKAKKKSESKGKNDPDIPPERSPLTHA